MSEESLEDQQGLHALLCRVREGSEEATNEFVARFGPYIRRVVRRHLDDRFRSLFDSTDFEQSVWTSVFADPEALRVHAQTKGIKRYLAVLAMNRVFDELRRCYYGPTYGVQRETSLDGSAALAAFQLSAPDPTPSQVAVAQETWKKVVEDQPPRQQEILRRRFLGSTQQEIAQELGIDERTVRRVLKHAQKNP
jgi:RNA polymerase sigma factor (sigma-70 family)